MTISHSGLITTKSEVAKLRYSHHRFGQQLLLFEDDVSLLQPSIYLKYHYKDVHIFDFGETDSMILEKDESTNVITVKYAHYGTFGYTSGSIYSLLF